MTTIEFESGVIEDLSDAIERLAPQELTYRHDQRWARAPLREALQGEVNGYSHVRSALIGPSLTVPLSGGRLLLGTWQQIVLFNFDIFPLQCFAAMGTRPRSREVVLQIMGGK